ncbi:MAG: SDR family oxidoreductase [Bacteroidetes bacterium]|nr:SDR family oxidoreductase [Bacteroidota bacterium]
MYDIPFHKTDISKLSFLITGGCGFIGSNIVEYLLKYNAGKVVVLDNVSTGFKKNIEPFLSNSNFSFIEGDITDFQTCKKACEGIDYVTHQAALGSVPRSVKDPIATHAVNATGFLNMLVAAKDAMVKRVVYASSSSVYGDHPVLPKKEDETGNPLSPYAVTKKTNELYANVFASTYQMEIIGLRYFNVFGPNQSPEGAYAAVIPLFMQAVINKTAPFIDGDGEQTRDFTFVENAVQANIKSFFAERKDAVNQIYNVAVGEKISVNSLYSMIAELGGSSVKPVHRETRAGDIRNSLADISKIHDLVGYEPGIKVNAGLKIAFDWYRKNFG